MANSFLFKTLFFIATTLISIVGQPKPWSSTLFSELSFDPRAIRAASTDFGGLTFASPTAVLYPGTVHDIAALIAFSYASPRPFVIAARGHGHSIRGQGLAHNGVVVEMSGLKLKGGGNSRIRVIVDGCGPGRAGPCADVGGEQLWVDVLNDALKHGLTPMSWTDYLYLTVGGTLSNAGVSGQAFRHGPQISNVYEMDVVTGKGEMLTCSDTQNPDLFYAALGGLGQFGVITRARIKLGPAPARARWVRLIYADFATFTRDQEHLTSRTHGGFDYVEGSVLRVTNFSTTWRSSFFKEEDLKRIRGAIAKEEEDGAIYCLEGAVYYDDLFTEYSVDQQLAGCIYLSGSYLGGAHLILFSSTGVDGLPFLLIVAKKAIDLLLEELNFIPGFVFTNDVSYFSFLNRVHDGEMELRSHGLWDVPHPWLNLFVPKSRMADFNQGVLKGILNQDNDPSSSSIGPILIYPLHKNKWDERTSAVIPEEEIFYSIGFLRSATVDNWEHLESQNQEILQFCHQQGMKFKHYLPHYTTQNEWKQHFGNKWDKFSRMKERYDPKSLLSPGQHIFTTPVDGSS